MKLMNFINLPNIGPERDEVTNKRVEKQQHEELRNLHSSPNIITMFKTVRLEWSGLEAGIRELINE
jgi:hypothetical protein